jgi:hypothetical protein
MVPQASSDRDKTIFKRGSGYYQSIVGPFAGFREAIQALSDLHIQLVVVNA